MGRIRKSEILMCRALATFLRKDALAYNVEEVRSTEAALSSRATVDGSQASHGHGATERREEESQIPAVLFRSIATPYALFLFAALACVLLLYSAVSDRWISIKSEAETIPKLQSLGLRYSCSGSNCKAIDFANLSTCGREEAAVRLRFIAPLVLISISVVLFSISAGISALMANRFANLRSIFKILRSSPEHFLKSAHTGHTEHPALERARLYADRLSERDDPSYAMSVRRHRERTEANKDQEMKDMRRGSETDPLADLWESDTDDDGQHHSSGRYRAPEVQFKRSLKRKELKIRLATKKVCEIRDSAQGAIYWIIVLSVLCWIGWTFAVAGTATFHTTAGSWLNCGRSICDVLSDVDCGYGPGFAAAITGTLAAAFCALFSVLVVAFGLADLYACLSAVMELVKLHEAQIRIVQKAAITGQRSRPSGDSSQLSGNNTSQPNSTVVVESESQFTPRGH